MKFRIVIHYLLLAACMLVPHWLPAFDWGLAAWYSVCLVAFQQREGRHKQGRSAKSEVLS